MMRCAATTFVAAFSFLVSPAALTAQTFPVDDAVLRRIWAVGMDSSQVYPLAQTLLDSIGPRLTGTPQQEAAVDWALARFAAWGIAGRKEQYGTFRGWRRGVTHVDLIAPRVRTLEGMLLAWSIGTGNKDVEGEAVLPPLESEDLTAWLASVKGKFVLRGEAQPTCRPPDDWERWAKPGAKPGRPASMPALPKRATLSLEQLEAAGVAGLISNNWSKGWGTDKLFSTKAKSVPSVQLSCEDFGLVYRLAENRQAPRLRLNADAQPLGDVPVYNTLGEIKGKVKPDEYVLLSAHYDSWDGASGATDNGTGSVIMLEAMRILKAAYPTPKRTILAALWNGEEQGLIGSKAFVKANPAIVEGVHALFNHDDGPGPVTSISGQGIKAAEQYFAAWFGKIPPELARDIQRDAPGTPDDGGTDHVSFIEAGAPAFPLIGPSWSYGTYTWHTNRDTFDKLSFDNLKANATLVAMLAYLASEDSVKMPHP